MVCFAIMNQLDQAQLGMPSRDYFLRGRDDRTLLTYQEFAVEVAVALGSPRTRALQEMSDMIDFEIQLANVGSIHSANV